MNLKAAFLHNLTDAMASVGVIVGGFIIMTFGFVWVDAVITLFIAGYVLYHGLGEIPKAIHLLMEGTPEGIVIDEVKAAIEKIEGVRDAHHMHVWQLCEKRNALEAHIVIDDLSSMNEIKLTLKKMLNEQFNIDHSTLEFEELSHAC